MVDRDSTRSNHETAVSGELHTLTSRINGLRLPLLSAYATVLAGAVVAGTCWGSKRLENQGNQIPNFGREGLQAPNRNVHDRKDIEDILTPIAQLVESRGHILSALEQHPAVDDAEVLNAHQRFKRNLLAQLSKHFPEYSDARYFNEDQFVDLIDKKLPQQLAQYGVLLVPLEYNVTVPDELPSLRKNFNLISLGGSKNVTRTIWGESFTTKVTLLGKRYSNVQSSESTSGHCNGYMGLSEPAGVLIFNSDIISANRTSLEALPPRPVDPSSEQWTVFTAREYLLGALQVRIKNGHSGTLTDAQLLAEDSTLMHELGHQHQDRFEIDRILPTHQASFQHELYATLTAFTHASKPAWELLSYLRQVMSDAVSTQTPDFEPHARARRWMWVNILGYAKAHPEHLKIPKQGPKESAAAYQNRVVRNLCTIFDSKEGMADLREYLHSRYEMQYEKAGPETIDYGRLSGYAGSALMMLGGAIFARRFSRRSRSLHIARDVVNEIKELNFDEEESKQLLEALDLQQTDSSTLYSRGRALAKLYASGDGGRQIADTLLTKWWREYRRDRGELTYSPPDFGRPTFVEARAMLQIEGLLRLLIPVEGFEHATHELCFHRFPENRDLLERFFSSAHSYTACAEAHDDPYVQRAFKESIAIHERFVSRNARRIAKKTPQPTQSSY